MSALPRSAQVDTSQQPPMTVPLQHFLVACLFLVAGAAVGLGSVAESGTTALAGTHLYLVGFVCVTIMGAMTQFVPVWSGVGLHSHRLGTIQLWLAAAGLAGVAGCLLLDALWLLPVFGGLLLAGVWTFVYNVGRTLAAVEDRDVTEHHFALALGFFVLATALGLLLAASYAGVLPWSVSHGTVAAAHATLAVFGAVLTTVFGALYQLATMFTGTDLDGVDAALQRVETTGYPVGVLALAGGRLVDAVWVARVGAALVLVGCLAVALVLCRRLVAATVERTPMLTRYAVVAVALAGWALLSASPWLRDPTAPTTTLGARGTATLLVVGVVGFVVVGTLYHVVPFIVWVHRYSDRVGFEDVPMVDDLYDDRLAATDFALFCVGTALLVARDLLPVPASVPRAGGALLALGAVAFAVNVVLVLREHSPYSLAGLLLRSEDPSGV